MLSTLLVSVFLPSILFEPNPIRLSLGHSYETSPALRLTLASSDVEAMRYNTYIVLCKSCVPNPIGVYHYPVR